MKSYALVFLVMSTMAEDFDRSDPGVAALLQKQLDAYKKAFKKDGMAPLVYADAAHHQIKLPTIGSEYLIAFEPSNDFLKKHWDNAERAKVLSGESTTAKTFRGVNCADLDKKCQCNVRVTLGRDEHSKSWCVVRSRSRHQDLEGQCVLEFLPEALFSNPESSCFLPKERRSSFESDSGSELSSKSGLSDDSDMSDDKSDLSVESAQTVKSVASEDLNALPPPLPVREFSSSVKSDGKPPPPVRGFERVTYSFKGGPAPKIIPRLVPNVRAVYGAD